MLAGTVLGQGFQPRSKISDQPNLRPAARATGVFIPGGVMVSPHSTSATRLDGLGETRKANPELSVNASVQGEPRSQVRTIPSSSIVAGLAFAVAGYFADRASTSRADVPWNVAVTRWPGGKIERTDEEAMRLTSDKTVR